MAAADCQRCAQLVIPHTSVSSSHGEILRLPCSAALDDRCRTAQDNSSPMRQRLNDQRSLPNHRNGETSRGSDMNLSPRGKDFRVTPSLRSGISVVRPPSAIGGDNPAGVALNQAGPNDEQTLGSATILAFCETAFIIDDPFQAGRRSYQFRYFSAQAEIPSCAPAAIAMAVAFRGRLGPVPIVSANNSGQIKVDVRTADGLTAAAQTSAAAYQSVRDDPATGAGAAAYGANLRDIGVPQAPCALTVRQGHDMGQPGGARVIVPAAGPIAVAGTAVPLGEPTDLAGEGTTHSYPRPEAAAR